MRNFFKSLFSSTKIETADIAIASDHRGVDLRHRIILYLKESGKTVIDCGPQHKDGSVDYPDYAQTVAGKVASKYANYGILICGTGIGMSIAANKLEGIRAARVATVEEARLSRLHNNANILCIGENTLELETLIHEWLTTGFEGGRHERRLKKIRAIEERYIFLP
jgi:ribose 5-phosphate isomerase B